MGYYSRLSGGFRIDPPIGYKELIDAGYDSDISERRLDLRGGWGEAFFILEIESKVTRDGILKTVKTSQVEVYDDQIKAYNLEESVRTLVADFGDAHTITGQITVVGEEDFDIWRIKVDDSVVIVEKPVLTWPDGSVQKL